MERRVVLLLCISVWGVVGEVDHPELRGEHPNQEDIDNGECIPIPCNVGVPPRECKLLCDTCNYETICQPPGDFCLCHHMVNGKMELVSPDEVKCPAPKVPEVDSSESSEPTSDSEPSKPTSDSEPSKPTSDSEPSKPTSDSEPSKPTTDTTGTTTTQQVDEETSMPENSGYISFQIFAVLRPIKDYLYESINEEEPSPTPIDSAKLGYEPVNVHEGRLFWDFRYILTGLLLLMVGLVLYELVMCALQYYGPRDDFPIKCEIPEVKIQPEFYESEKILKA